MKKKGLFVTGTDTEVGKTIVSVKLMRELTISGKNVAGYKPVASDARLINGKLVNDDAVKLMEASSSPHSYNIHNPFVYEKAISPNIAANQTNNDLSLDCIKNNFLELSKAHDLVVVEGAGGWRSPLSDAYSAVDLVNVLNIPVLLVVELKLGCINHALLSAEVMEKDGVEVMGWLANGPIQDLQETQGVIKTLENKMPFQLLGRVYCDKRSAIKDDLVQVCEYF